ncbi:RNA polymerase sigma-70 factor (ECF subfamily) [Leeuwenhoekiella aestuarii]|nr:RNA polymerase sigma-70 factor (ECF subfamily) [Leeuwenhoekiella aestuarii]
MYFAFSQLSLTIKFDRTYLNTNDTFIKSIFQEEYKALCIYAYGYLLDKDDAQDIVQDVFVRLLDSDNLDHINNLKAYIKTSIYHSCLKELRNKSKTNSLTPVEDRIASIALTQEAKLIKQEESQLLLNELQLLPKECRKAFELCVLHGYKYTEAADSLNISKNTIKTHIKKAYKILRESMRIAQVLWFFTSF